MTDFDKNVLPKENEVISVWISKYDQARGLKRQLSKSAKNEIIEDIVQSLIFIWQSQNIPIIGASRIKAQLSKIKISIHKLLWKTKTFFAFYMVYRHLYESFLKIPFLNC